MNTQLKFSVTEVVSTTVSRKSRGYKMSTGIMGRRKQVEWVSTSTGKFVGKVFTEETVSHSGDWGDGWETKTNILENIVAEISPNADRNLVERRTKAVFDALVAVEAAAIPPGFMELAGSGITRSGT
jgi:hypothetical protein